MGWTVYPSRLFEIADEVPSVKIVDLKTSNRLVAERRQQDPEFREAWDRLAVAREIAVQVLRYRTENGLSQRDLATEVGLKQPAIARLENAETQPTLDTLARLSTAPGLVFAIGVSKGAVHLLPSHLADTA
jgi:ribosome-binding protein aMBF1 (putative translation factor)